MNAGAVTKHAHRKSDAAGGNCDAIRQAFGQQVVAQAVSADAFQGVGKDKAGRISGVTRFGCFVRLDETGADGLIPIRTLGREFFHYDARTQTLMGADTGMTLSVGQRVTVRLAEAVPVTGGLMLELLEVEGGPMPGGASARRGGPVRRKSGQSRARSGNVKRKVERRRKGK